MVLRPKRLHDDFKLVHHSQNIGKLVKNATRLPLQETERIESMSTSSWRAFIHVKISWVQMILPKASTNIDASEIVACCALPATELLYRLNEGSSNRTFSSTNVCFYRKLS